MPHRFRLLSALALAAATAACGARTTAASPGVVVEPTEKNVEPFLDVGDNSRSLRTPWVTNRSTIPIVVTHVTLIQCENVGQPCGAPITTTVSIPPGERRVVLRISPDQITNPMRFDYTFAWKRADR